MGPARLAGKNGAKKTDVVVVTVALEVLARYEALFRNANFHPGEVTTSALAALNLYRETGVAVIAKLAGNVLTVMAQMEGRLKLFRCLEVDPASDEEMLGVLFPTFAYVEDELGQPVQQTDPVRFRARARRLERGDRHRSKPLTEQPVPSMPACWDIWRHEDVKPCAFPSILRASRSAATEPSWSLLASCGVVLMALLARDGVPDRDRARAALKETRVAVENLNSDLRKITAEQAQVDATLRQPANAEVLQRSLLLNALIERKSISWAKIFADLESVLPNDVRLIQIRLPQINSRNEVSLDMEVGAKDPAPVIKFLENLENSPLFGPSRNPRVTPPTQSEPLYRYRITVNYAQKL